MLRFCCRDTETDEAVVINATDFVAGITIVDAVCAIREIGYRIVRVMVF